MTKDELRIECLTLALEVASGAGPQVIAEMATRIEALVGRATEGLRPKQKRNTDSWTPERRAAAAERMRARVSGQKQPPLSEVDRFIAEKGVTKVPPGYAAETSAARR